MKVVRLVKNSDFKSVEHLVKHSGKGMTTMPKTTKEIKERIAWSEKSRNKKTKKPNQDSYLFVLEDNGRIVGLSAIYTSVSLKKPRRRGTIPKRCSQITGQTPIGRIFRDSA